MKREDDPQLWDLLSRSQSIGPSPFFARNVVRAVRNEEAAGGSFYFWWRRVIPAFSAVMAALLLSVSWHAVREYRSHARGEMFASVDAQDNDVAADLDVLVNNDDDSDDSFLL